MARKAYGLTIRSTTVGSEGFRGVMPVVDPLNGSTSSGSVTDIGTSSGAITATAALIATDNTNLTNAATNINTSSGAITATAALIATDNTDLGTTDNTAVEAAVALLEADGAIPTQAHVNALRTVWDTMKTHLTSLGTHSGTATSDASTLATRNTTLGSNRTSLGTHSGTATSDASTLATRYTALAGDVAGNPAYDDVILSYDVTAVGNRSVLRRAADELIAATASSNDLTA